MNELPKISIVTPSFNQGAYLDETLQSLVDQDYSNLEVIVQDAGSTDNSIEIAKKFALTYPRKIKLYVEKDHGQADAINRGFQKATGAIFGFLNSDDLLLPGCLHRVAKEIDPMHGRHVVFGRSVFFGNDPAKEGKEHPLCTIRISINSPSGNENITKFRNPQRFGIEVSGRTAVESTPHSSRS